MCQLGEIQNKSTEVRVSIEDLNGMQTFEKVSRDPTPVNNNHKGATVAPPLIALPQHYTS